METIQAENIKKISNNNFLQQLTEKIENFQKNYNRLDLEKSLTFSEMYEK